MDGIVFVERILASRGACEGVMRVAASGRYVSGVAVLMVMKLLPALTGRTKLPAKVAPASRSRVSPGRARLMAAWRSPPAGTRTVPGGCGAGSAGGTGLPEGCCGRL